MMEYNSHLFECTECNEWQRFRGFRLDQKQCDNCGSYSFIQLKQDELHIKIKTGKQFNKSQTSVASPN